MTTTDSSSAASLIISNDSLLHSFCDDKSELLHIQSKRLKDDEFSIEVVN